MLEEMDKEVDLQLAGNDGGGQDGSWGNDAELSQKFGKGDDGRGCEGEGKCGDEVVKGEVGEKEVL